MKKVLIIGAKGMLGQELVSVFRSDKTYEVIAWDKEDVDITNSKELEEKIKRLKPQIIINSAAFNNVDACEEAETFKLAKKINGIAPGKLAEIAKELKAAFVHYSSDYVFGGNLPEMEEPKGCTHSCGSCGLHAGFMPNIGYLEESKPKPVSAYGKSKLLGEKNVQKAGGKYYIIRLSKLFGKPAQAEGSKKSFFDVMLEIGKKNKGVHPIKYPLKKGAALPLLNGVKVVDDETSFFTYAPDLAKKTKEIIEANKTPGIYHVTNSDSCTWYEAVLELYGQAGIKARVIPVTAEEFPRPAKRASISTLLNTKLNPLRSYKEALKEYLKNKK
jgi:dTDP-4-dehydrorhamnose reductase